MSSHHRKSQYSGSLANRKMDAELDWAKKVPAIILLAVFATLVSYAILEILLAGLWLYPILDVFFLVALLSLFLYLEFGFPPYLVPDFENSRLFRRRPQTRKLLGRLVAVVIIAVIILVPTGLVPGLPPPSPPTTYVYPILTESSQSLTSGLGHALSFEFEFLVFPPVGGYCPYYWDGPWCLTGSTSFSGEFSITSCETSGQCSAMVAIYSLAAWSSVLNGTNETPSWCSGEVQGSCSPVSMAQLPSSPSYYLANQEAVVAVWSPSGAPHCTFTLALDRDYQATYFRG